jgi:signal transduction histidine kinase
MIPNPMYPSAASLRRLTSVSRALARATSLDQVLDLSVSCATDLLHAERSAIVLPDLDGVLRIAAARGIPAEDTARFHHTFDETLASRLEGIFGFGAAGSERLLAAPLIVWGRIPGVLAVDRRPERAIADESWLLSALADQISLGIENARREEARAGLERELKDARSRTERALDLAKHDLRTPLNAILGYLELLVDGDLGALSDTQKEVLERVRDVSTHLHAVLENALRAAQGEARRPSEIVRAADLVREAATLVTPAAREKQIRLELELEEAVRVRCDAGRLRQALVNVLDNAVKYSPSSTRVLVSERVCRVEGEPWCGIDVADEGPGIPPESAEDVFAFGHRLPRPSDPGGSGLGLFIARTLIHEMGGRILIEPRPEPGTTVRIRVPLAPVVEAGQTGRTGPSGQTGQTGATGATGGPH